MHSDRQYITCLNNNEETGISKLGHSLAKYMYMYIIGTMMMSGKWLWLDQSVFVNNNSYNFYLFFFSDDVVITIRKLVLHRYKYKMEGNIRSLVMKAWHNRWSAAKFSVQCRKLLDTQSSSHLAGEICILDITQRNHCYFVLTVCQNCTRAAM